MRAVQVDELSGPDSLRLVERCDLAPDPGTVQIEVHAAGVAFPDVLMSRGQYQHKPDLPFVPGGEVAGIVRSAPPSSHVRVGDRVAAFAGLGGFAEQAAVDPGRVFALPEQVTFAAGAALPMNYLTAHFALVRRARLLPGETVLVHGAAGGVGTACAQLCRALGARVVAVVSDDAKREAARLAGATDVIAVDGFRQAVAELTDGRGVDLVVDPVGGDRFTDSLRSLAPEGRLLVVGFTGREIPTVKVNRLLLNNISIVGLSWGAFLRSRPGYFQEQWAQLRPMVESGALDPVIGAIYPLEQAGRAVRDLDERKAMGKIILALR